MLKAELYRFWNNLQSEKAICLASEDWEIINVSELYSNIIGLLNDQLRLVMSVKHQTAD